MANVKTLRTIRRRAAGALLLAIVLVPAAAGAQGAENVRDYLERTGELLGWARDLVQETENLPARKVLREAVDLHERAVQLAVDSRPLQALTVDRRARSAVWLSVKLAREAMNYQERARIREERFREVHHHLSERARDERNQPALDLLRQAENQAERAREQLMQGDARLALEQFNQAERLLRRVRNLLDDGGPADRIEQDLDRTGMLIEQAHERLGDGADDAARGLLEEAAGMLDDARGQLAQGRPAHARRLAEQARHLARRAVEATGGAPDPEAIRRQIENWDERSARIEEEIRDSGSRPAVEAYRKALDHRRRAAELLGAGEPERALRQIRAAHQLLDQTRKSIR